MKYVGVDIGGTNLKAGLVDESGTLLATQKMKVASIVDREGLAWTVASLVQELAKAANIPVSDVASVGVGVPGTVDIRAVLSRIPATFPCGTCRCESCFTNI